MHYDVRCKLRCTLSVHQEVYTEKVYIGKCTLESVHRERVDRKCTPKSVDRKCTPGSVHREVYTGKYTPGRRSVHRKVYNEGVHLPVYTKVYNVRPPCCPQLLWPGLISKCTPKCTPEVYTGSVHWRYAEGLMSRMEKEGGIKPDAVTWNSLFYQDDPLTPARLEDQFEKLYTEKEYTGKCTPRKGRPEVYTEKCRPEVYTGKCTQRSVHREVYTGKGTPGSIHREGYTRMYIGKCTPKVYTDKYTENCTPGNVHREMYTEKCTPECTSESVQRRCTPSGVHESVQRASSLLSSALVARPHIKVYTKVYTRSVHRKCTPEV
ncbi:hypothetical protein F2Q70_00026449 [Brassica cretica]|uniref:Uncharacterized protein n=1 Tax=Brassica cretica TaxID=69181 RepID=A0A8S9L814_BRACR|nr:hypothetical protein F2Q70_00026449 [Brassica cretica]